MKTPTKAVLCFLIGTLSAPAFGVAKDFQPEYYEPAHDVKFAPASETRTQARPTPAATQRRPETRTQSTPPPRVTRTSTSQPSTRSQPPVRTQTPARTPSNRFAGRDDMRRQTPTRTRTPVTRIDPPNRGDRPHSVPEINGEQTGLALCLLLGIVLIMRERRIGNL